jgi:putative FmdB family regulatory protein
MPMYEYACRDCEHTFEALVFNGEKVDCPECHSVKLERLLSVPAKPAASGVSDRPGSLPMRCDPKLPPCGPSCCRV